MLGTHCRDPHLSTVPIAITKEAGSEKHVRDLGSSRVDYFLPPPSLSALYALYRFSVFSGNHRDHIPNFEHLWSNDIISLLLKSFLQVETRNHDLSLQERKYAGLSLANLCSDERIREFLTELQEREELGLNILEMIEWFLQEEVYHKL